MKCRYCGIESKEKNICSKCYDKLKLVRQLKKIGEQIRKEVLQADNG
ncbi:MAG: hypothetical protein IJD11_00530 [Oscillospiraceae bacterium]|nr:hypothetical protein [Oscillospiraceae bacterium]